MEKLMFYANAFRGTSLCMLRQTLEYSEYCKAVTVMMNLLCVAAEAVVDGRIVNSQNRPLTDDHLAFIFGAPIDEFAETISRLTEVGMAAFR